jgi:hypothetical protein
MKHHRQLLVFLLASHRSLMRRVIACFSRGIGPNCDVVFDAVSFGLMTMVVTSGLCGIQGVINYLATIVRVPSFMPVPPPLVFR